MPTPEEHRRRDQLWDELLARGGPRGVEPTILRALRLYGGAQGIWVDKETTANAQAPHGIAVSVLHTGRSYADDLAADGVVYHYPATGRTAGRYAAEVEALKAACVHELPVFVVTTAVPRRLRDVARGFVAGYDDQSRQCLILFGDAPPRRTANDDTEFALRQSRSRKATAGTRATRSAAFQFGVLRRYGARCAVCDIAVAQVVDAAHLRPVDEDGSDDPRNGLPLCATHHRAFDASLFGLEPGGALRIVPAEGGPSLRDLRITRADLAHLGALPHPEAVAWRWVHKRPRTGPTSALDAPADDAGPA
jgi:putative restriction endonuclease